VLLATSPPEALGPAFSEPARKPWPSPAAANDFPAEIMKRIKKKKRKKGKKE